jgi:hypothetical protein
MIQITSRLSLDKNGIYYSISPSLLDQMMIFISNEQKNTISVELTLNFYRIQKELFLPKPTIPE